MLVYVCKLFLASLHFASHTSIAVFVFPGERFRTQNRPWLNVVKYIQHLELKLYESFENCTVWTLQK
jgi:hypothetical protein